MQSVLEAINQEIAKLEAEIAKLNEAKRIVGGGQLELPLSTPEPAQPSSEPPKPTRRGRNKTAPAESSPEPTKAEASPPASSEADDLLFG